VLRVSTTSHIIELINAPFLYQRMGTRAEYKAGLEHAIAKGWLVLHESGLMSALLFA